MESFKVVHPGHLNHYGYLYGGVLLQWVDEAAWIAASRDHPQCNFVTVGMDRVEFRKSVRQGALLRFDVNMTRLGNTSIQYSVQVFSKDIKGEKEGSIFSTTITFVCLDNEGNKRPINE